MGHILSSNVLSDRTQRLRRVFPHARRFGAMELFPLARVIPLTFSPSFLVHTYVSDLSYGIRDFVEQSPLYKEAILELATAHKITYVRKLKKYRAIICVFILFVRVHSMAIVKDVKQWEKTANKRTSSYCRVGLADGAMYVVPFVKVQLILHTYGAYRVIQGD